MSIARGTVGWWRMDGNLTDASGNGNHATVFSGTNGYAHGVYGQARDYGAGGDNVILGKSPWGADNKFTISAWIKTGTTTLNRAPFGALNDGGTTAIIIQTNRDGAGNGVLLFFLRKEDGSNLLLQTENEAHPNLEWFFLTVTNDEENMRIYVNGVLAAQGATPAGDLVDLTYGLGLGFSNSRGSVSADFTGQIDNLLIENYARTPSQIKTLYALGSPL